MNEAVNVVFIHGWGLNSAVWSPLLSALADSNNRVRPHAIDLPGYGTNSHLDTSSDLQALAEHCLDIAPDEAIWVGWSLGGMVAMQAAILDAQRGHHRISALQLINTTPRFIAGLGWPHGVEIELFERFCAGLTDDYHRHLNSFLLLQAGANRGARALARELVTLIGHYPPPSRTTLERGLQCLAGSDLRGMLHHIDLLVQVVCGMQDRVTHPESSRFLARELNTPLVQMNSGHVPFLTHTDDYLRALESLLQESVVVL